jgi:hypothetical protein
MPYYSDSCTSFKPINCRLVPVFNMGFELRVAKLHPEVMQLWAYTFAKLLCLNGSTSHAFLLALHSLIHLTTEEKSRRNSVSAGEKCPAEQRWHDLLCWLGHLFRGSLNWPADLSHTWFALQVTWVNPRSAWVSLNCLNKGFPTAANNESNASARGLVWSAKNGSTKYSWICL